MVAVPFQDGVGDLLVDDVVLDQRQPRLSHGSYRAAGASAPADVSAKR